MTSEHYPQDTSDLAPDASPSLELQQQRLKVIQSRHMVRIVSDRDFFNKLKEKYEKIYEDRPDKPGADVSLSVSVMPLGKTEQLYVLFSNNGVGTFVEVADRITTQDGGQLVTEDGFSKEQAQLLADMADELAIAKTSGEIPDLTESLDHVYIPIPQAA